MCEGDQKCIQKSMENFYGRDYVGDLVIDGRTVLKSVLQDGVRCLQD
jgi:hypothetical protein